MQRHIIVVTLPDWSEKHYYIGGGGKWDAVVELADRMRRVDNGIRSLVCTIDTADETEFWYRCGVRGFNVSPPKKHATSYVIGRRMWAMRQSNETPLAVEEEQDMRDEDLRIICVVEGDVSAKAISDIKTLNPKISVKAVGLWTLTGQPKTSTRFATHEPITEYDRAAWENIIRGVVQVM